MAKVRVFSMAIAVACATGICGWGTAAALAAEPPEPAVGAPGAEGDYLRAVHARLHPNWVDGYIRVSPYKVLGPSTSRRLAEVSITIRWDGTIDQAEITKSSGVDDFDDAALNAVQLSAPFPPPVNVMADDGFVHVKWQFARNFRLCSAAQITPVEYPLQVALPNLAARGQLGEALRRMREQMYHGGWTQDFLSPFIKQWLGRSNLSSELDARATAALAAAGDREQLKQLRPLLSNAQTAAIAAPALDHLGVDVAAGLTKMLATGGDDPAPKRAAALAAIRAMPAVLAHCQPCTDIVALSVADTRQPAATRVALIEMLGRAERTERVAQGLALAAKDSNAAVRGAALLAQMPPGHGRPGVIKMAALLHDPAAEIRAAASAGVLRAGGDAGIEQLYLLTRDRDVRPLIAAAGELGRMSSEASADLLRRLLKRPEPAVRVAVVTALAGRRDAAARALVEPILVAARQNATEDPAIRLLALPGCSPSELLSMLTDARLGLAVYRALLVAQLRPESARWLLDNLEQLSEEDRITALGDWIAEPAQVATTAQQ